MAPSKERETTVPPQLVFDEGQTPPHYPVNNTITRLTMYRHILVAVDGSDTSNLALLEAIKLAKEQEAALRLVHVVDESPAYFTMDTAYAREDFQKAMRDSGQNMLAANASKVRDSGVSVDTKFIVLEAVADRIYAAITEEAKRWPADLIIIGTHGRHGFDRFLLGSVAEGVIRVATKPVLVIRGN